MDSAGSAGGGVTEMDAVGDSMHSQSVSNEKVNTKVGYKCFKRIFDIVSSSLGLIILSPLFLIIAIAIMLEDGAPVFFVQERNGLNGKYLECISSDLCAKMQQRCITICLSRMNLMDQHLR